MGVCQRAGRDSNPYLSPCRNERLSFRLPAHRYKMMETAVGFDPTVR